MIAIAMNLRVFLHAGIQAGYCVFCMYKMHAVIVASDV